ncbi:hypothetical protein [Paenibacillus amylolyticus]|uniref:hypothetical protein n=1 Tax=Paenibacillus amylolyticus TaxID=1451 RepID=UPI003EB87832
MKKELRMLLFLSGIIVILVACGNEARNNTNLNEAVDEQAIEQHQKEDKEENKIDKEPNRPDSPALADFERGVFIDFDKERNPLLNDQIKKVLKKYLVAQARSDEKTFRSTFKDSKTAAAYMWSYDGDYKFTDINHISKDETKNQILVTVEGEMIRENKIEHAAVTVYFVVDQAGRWSIIAVD